MARKPVKPTKKKKPPKVSAPFSKPLPGGRTTGPGAGEYVMVDGREYKLSGGNGFGEMTPDGATPKKTMFPVAPRNKRRVY